MKNTAITLLLGTLALPGLAFAHSGHAPLAGLPDLLLHHPWTALLVLALGVGGLSLLGAQRARARSRRR
jgi:membrane protein implicated in regulation of membrane protease activity